MRRQLLKQLGDSGVDVGALEKEESRAVSDKLYRFPDSTGPREEALWTSRNG